ncbi:MAG: phosphopantetheine-binding protein [bacterium]
MQMTRQELVEKLRVLMQKSSPRKVDWNSMTEQTDIVSLGFDSLSVLDLIYDVQRGFELEFDAEQITEVKTVGDLVTFLDRKLKSKSGQG